MTQPAIEVQNLGKSYVLNRKSGEAANRTVWVLNDISFKAEPGDVIGIIGKNGAGKSTLLKILARITEPTRGKAIIRGRVASLLEVGTGFHDELSGRENVFMNGTLLGMTPTEVRKRFDEIVAFSGVERYIDQPVKHYSSGMRVRLAFSVAAHLDPEVMFIDEVLSVGDMEFQDRCLKRMNQLTTEFGRTVLFVSHNMNAVATLCPRALLLNQGKCVALGPTGEVIKQYHGLVHGIKEKRGLAEREDRTGAGGVRFLEVQIQDGSGKPVEFARSGTPLRLALRYRFDADTPLSDRVTLNVAFNNARGQRLFATPSDLMGKVDGKVAREGWCFVEIPKLPLMPGRYEIDIAFQIDRLTLDKVAGAAVVPVVEGPFYPTNRLPNSLSGDLLVDYEWSLSTGASLPAKPKPKPAPARVEVGKEPIAGQLQAMAAPVNVLEKNARELLEQAVPEADRHQQLTGEAEAGEARLAALRSLLPAGDDASLQVADRLAAAFGRIRRHLAEAELAALLGVAVPAVVHERGLPVDDPRIAMRDQPGPAIAEFGKPVVGLAAFVNQAMAAWQSQERQRQRQALEIIAARASAYLERADAILARAPEDPTGQNVHRQVTTRLREILHHVAFLQAAPADATPEDLKRSWLRARAAREEVLRAPSEVPDQPNQPLQTRLARIAPAVNALEKASAALVTQAQPIDPARHGQLRQWAEGFAGRVAALRAQAGESDHHPIRMAGELAAALGRARQNLDDVELPMLLGVPVPGGGLGRDLAADDPRLAERATAGATIAEFSRPAVLLTEHVEHALAHWQGSDPQRQAMAIVAGRARGFLARADELLASAAADTDAIDVHNQVTLRLKDVLDWAEYLRNAPAGAGAGAEPLFAAWQRASRVRELHLSQIFQGIEAVSVPIGAINQESAHENQVDLLYVSAIAKAIGARRMFEVGTYMGRTTWHLAALAPDVQVWTLNLPPEADPRIAPVLGSYYRGKPEAARIHELWTDSKTFEPGELAGTMDFVFVDADHSYDAVMADTERALKLVRPGGVVLWHDYAAKSPGVVRFAHDFAKARPLFRIKHTCLLCLIEGVDAESFQPYPMRRGLGD
ncbi:MAG TPA: ATP-binding cassette domain-containing protein [Geminicoccus sp.]|uniref:ATP-binding cassette domain-containing protein n=1 Tax=Geminicoccus sp. TaxID=2024832 RepID=UPI002B6E1D3B|nr:ATP-binding cassette domain-containing protein [Geminicoccus sp.]HWL70934.1 ATP-binding cassette domain-containing protein [Geminicoccus sp.]